MVGGFGGGVVSGLGFVLGVDGGTFVFDISDVTVVVVGGVGHGLDTTIGKSHLVRSGDSLAVSGFLSVEVGSRVVIGNSVLESIGLGGLVFVGGGVVGRGIGGGGVVGGGGSGWESNGDGHEGGEGGNAEHVDK